MRLVQAALISDKAKAMALLIYIRANFHMLSGELKDTTFTPKLRELFEKHSEDLNFMSLYAWVLGQLGAHVELAELKKHVEKLR